MKNRVRMSAVACAAALTVTGFANSATAQSAASVSFDLRVHSTGAKEAVVNKVGDVLTLDLFATVTGSDGNATNDGLIVVSGNFRSSIGGLLGDLLMLPPVAPFNSTVSPGTHWDVDGDGDIDIGSVDLTKNHDVFVLGTGGSIVQTPPGGILVTQVRFSATSLSETPTTVNLLPNMYKVIVGQAAGVSFDGRRLQVWGGDPSFHIGSGVTIRAGTRIDPGPITYLSGTIATHLTVAGNVEPSPGSTLTVANGISIPAEGSFNSGLGGTHQVVINDSISDNSGGSLITGKMLVGASSAGAFAHTAGYTSIGQLTVGAGASGSVSVGGGTFLAQNAIIGSAGSFTNSAGVTTINSLTMSDTAGSSTLHISGGELSVTGAALAGKVGSATINQSGGAVILNGTSYLGSTSTGSGVYNLSDGTLAANWLNVGGQGYGEVNQTGGAATLSRIEVGRFASAATGFQGKYTLSNGTLNATVAMIGDTGNGVMLQNGGTATIDRLYLRNNTLATQYQLQGGTLNSGIANVGFKSTVFDADKPARFEQSSGTHSTDHLVIAPLGIYQMTGGTLRINKDIQLKGTIDLTGSSATVVAATSSFVDFATGTLAGASNATVTGETDSLINFAAGFDPFTQIGHFSSQGLVHIAGQPLIVPQGRAVHGNGSIQGDVSNAGLISPGNSPGAISITGNYQQDPVGVLQIELGGTASDEFDSLSVTGSALLAGTLNVTLLGDFVPAPGDQFTILSASGRSGGFNTINIAGGTFDVNYSSTGVTLGNFAAAVPEPLALSAFLALPLTLRRRRYNN